MLRFYFLTKSSEKRSAFLHTRYFRIKSNNFKKKKPNSEIGSAAFGIWIFLIKNLEFFEYRKTSNFQLLRLFLNFRWEIIVKHLQLTIRFSRFDLFNQVNDFPICFQQTCRFRSIFRLNSTRHQFNMKVI